MRSTFYLILFFISLTAFSEDFIVFEENGFFGVKDSSGEVTIPPVYEKLGWSSGDNEIFQGLIGYKRGDLWGLISVRNRALTEQKFHSLEPFSSGYVKGAIKGKFSNQLFYGLLDTRGKTVVSFNYFELSSFGTELLVSEFQEGEQSYGLISIKNELLIPLKYKKISKKSSFTIASTFDHRLDVFHNNSLVESALDSIQLNDGLVGFRAGYVGFIDQYGQTIYDFNYKSILSKDGELNPTEFPIWKTFKGQTLHSQWQCDSLKLIGNGIWVSYLNGAQHIAVPGFGSKDYVIKNIEDNFAIVQHSKTRKYAVVNEEGRFLINGYDSIVFSQTHFLALKKKKWDILNSSGTKLNKQPFDHVLVGPKNFFITFKNNYWGVVDFTGAEYLTFKYDSIVYSSSNYKVKYIDKWGTIDFHGNWKVLPEFSEVLSYGNVSIGRKGQGYSVFHDGHFRYKMTYRPISSLDNFIIIEGDSNRVGVINELGDLIAEPNYSSVAKEGDFLILKRDGFSTLISKGGKKLLSEREEVQEIGSLSEGYFSFKKNNRWGFIDLTGRLRISNRYDSVLFFSDGVAPIQLRDRWGFVDSEESLVIQPYYDHVSAFENGLAIVRIEDKVGIIDQAGQSILAVNYNYLKRLPTRNYLVKDVEGRLGLIDSNGKFIIRPSYEYLEDTGTGLVVMQDGFWGYLDYDANQMYKLTYAFVQVIENYVVVKM